MRSFRTFVSVSALIAAPLFFGNSALAEGVTLPQDFQNAGQAFAAKGASALVAAPAARDADGVVAGLNTAPASAASKDAAAAVGGYGDGQTREAVLNQIFQALPIEQIFEAGAEKGITQIDAVKSMTPAQQQHLVALTQQEIGVRDRALAHDLAVSNGQDLTLDQLQEILLVVRVPLVQQAFLAGATGVNPTNITPPTPAEQVVLNRAQQEVFVMNFIKTINVDVAGADLQAAFSVAGWRISNAQ
jgi:hypothetical protein